MPDEHFQPVGNNKRKADDLENQMGLLSFDHFHNFAIIHQMIHHKAIKILIYRIPNADFTSHFFPTLGAKNVDFASIAEVSILPSIACQFFTLCLIHAFRTSRATRSQPSSRNRGSSATTLDMASNNTSSSSSE